ncbi:MAG: V-type ATP synthase subunit I [Candidatus Wallbacteria bacterium]|nr:V-type ATP synthase subunit I [Candidatus Wallbacteria bacterium]
MAIRDISKITVFGLRSSQEKVLEFIQHFGDTQLAPALPDQMQKAAEPAHEALSQADFCLSFLKPLTPSKGFIESLTEESLVRDFSWVKNLVQSYNLESTHRQLKEIDFNLKELSRRERELQNELEQLDRFRDLPVDLAELRRMKWVRHALVQVETKSSQDLESALAENLVHIINLRQDSKYAYLFLLFHRQEEQKTGELFARFGVSVERPPMTAGTFSSRIKTDEEELKRLSAERNRLLDSARAFLHDVDSLVIIRDYHQSLQVRSNEKSNLFTSRYTFAIKAFVPSDRSEEFSEKLSKAVEGIEVFIEKIPAGEEAPVLLSNPRIVQPFEVITSLYGLPNRREYDPTPLFSVFFIFFFSICLGDAGYGLILFLLAWYIRKKFKLQGNANGFYTLLLMCGLVSIFTGILLGGYFGLSPETMGQYLGMSPESLTGLPAALKKVRFIDPMSQAVNFLLIAVLLGVIQIIWGILVRTCLHIKRGDTAAVAFDDLPWAVYFAAIAPCVYFRGTAAGTAFLWLTILAVAVIILFAGRAFKNPIGRVLFGIYQLYNGTFGFLGNTLSYSRLMALSLSGGGIGMVINTLAGVINDLIPGLGVLVAIIFVPVGHFANVILSTMGGFIHSMRLQYVEFFPNFYECGGKPFRPFCFRFRKVILSEN